MTATKALLLAGGLGTRLRPLTDSVPKCLVPVAGKPMLDYWLDALETAGIETALVNTHHHADVVRTFIDRTNAIRPLTLEESYEPELLGSAGTIAANRDWGAEADEILVIYADNLSDVDLTAFLEAHRAHDDPLTMLLFRAPDPKAAGIATLDTDGRITEFVEKPKAPKSDLANAGLYVMSPAAWVETADLGAFDIGFDVLPRFVGRMRGHVHRGYHRDIGTPEALAAAEADAPRIFAG